MNHRPRRRVAAGLLALFALIGAACSRDSDENEVGADTTQPAGGSTQTTAADGATGSLLDQGGFGDLENVCQDGDASGATDVGVTDDAIEVGTITDKGFTSRPGLNEEMYDAAVAFAQWCNSHGGILGRELRVADRDAALTDFNARIIESCDQDFALVGGGAVLDDADNGGRIACGLPNIPGYVVSAGAREADLQVAPLPNPLHTFQAGPYRRLAEARPELIDHYGILTATFGSVLLVRDISVQAAEQNGFTVVYNKEFNPGGESNWRPFVEEMQAASVEIFEFVGEPTFFGQILEAMDAVGYMPDLMIESANFYDTQFRENSGAIAQNVRVRTQYTPYELADQNQAIQDYLTLMDTYGGKVASLGTQAMSAFLLFAQAATACGSNLTRACLLEQAGSVTEWTGGGMHAPQNPSTNAPSACFAFLSLTTDAFAVDEELTGATDGIFNCDPANIIQVNP